MGPRILILEARYYVELSDALLDGAMRALGPAEARVERVNVPGAFEIPGAIALARNAFDGFVALGCIIRGETYHFDIVANESARGLMELAIRDKVALGNGILTVDDEAQAWARARAEERDHGGAAARACLAMVALKARFSGGTV